MLYRVAVVYNDSVEGTSEKKYGQNYDWTKNNDLKEEVRNRLNKSGLGQVDDILRVLDGCDDDRFIDLGVREQVGLGQNYDLYMLYLLIYCRA